MTRTEVVFGIAALGRPEAAPDCACATDAARSTAMNKGIVNFIELSFQFGVVHFYIEDCRTLSAQKKVTLQRTS